MTTTATDAPPEGYTEAAIYGGHRIFIREEKTCEMPGGLVGYYMTEHGGCLQAAAATVLQRPLEDLPDTTRSGVLRQWAEANGYYLTTVRPGVDPRPEGLAIGVSVSFPDGLIANARHTVVLRDGRIVFDPASCFLWPGGHPVQPTTAGEIEYALTFQPKKEMRH